MKKIYIPQGGGRDFWLRIPMNNESAGRHLCMDDVDENDMHVWLESGYGGCWTLVWEKDGAQRDGIAAKVPASFLGYGTYSVVMAGKFVNGDYFRTKRQLFIRLVDREDQADAEPTMYNEEQAYWAGPAVLSEMLSRDGLNTYELWILQGNEGSLEDYLSVSGLTLNDFMVQWNHLSVDVQTKIQRGEEKGIEVKGDYSATTTYDVNDLVFDPTTNSSYISKHASNTGNALTNTEHWMKTMDGSDVLRAIEDADDATDAANTAAATAESAAAGAVTTITEALTGYFTCGASTDKGGLQTKVVDNDHDYIKPSYGGAMKIRMYQVNTYVPTTGNPVKLKIGDETAAELLYNREPVTPDNSWEENEVISVYYDGTYYQASNAQGGGGKAEKIKYDNSQNGLAATDVQGALDDMCLEIFPNKQYEFEDMARAYPKNGNTYVNTRYKCIIKVPSIPTTVKVSGIPEGYSAEIVGYVTEADSFNAQVSAVQYATWGSSEFTFTNNTVGYAGLNIRKGDGSQTIGSSDLEALASIKIELVVQDGIEVDNEPTLNSKNLVRSGGIFNSIAETTGAVVNYDGSVWTIWGYYINTSGVLTSNSDWAVSNPILLKKGWTVEVNTQGTNVAVIALTDSSGSSYTQLVNSGSASGNNKFTYTSVSDNDIYVALSGKVGLGDVTASLTIPSQFDVLSNDIDTINTALYGSTEITTKGLEDADIALVKRTSSSPYVAETTTLTDAFRLRLIYQVPKGASFSAQCTLYSGIESCLYSTRQKCIISSSDYIERFSNGYVTSLITGTTSSEGFLVFSWKNENGDTFTQQEYDAFMANVQVSISYYESVDPANSIEGRITALENASLGSDNSNIAFLPIPSVVQGCYEQGSPGTQEGGVGDTTRTDLATTNSLMLLPYNGVTLHAVLPDGIGCWFKLQNGPKITNSSSILCVNGTTINCASQFNAYMIAFCYVANGSATGAAISPADVNALINSGEIKFWYEEKEGNVIQRTTTEDTYIMAVTQLWYPNQEGIFGRHNDDPVFLHISDIHGDGVRLNNALQWGEYKGVDAVINTGDNVFLSEHSGQGFIADIGSKYNVSQVVVVGNHEAYSSKDNSYRSNSNTALYNTLIKPFENSYTMPSSSDYDDAPTYYYKDYPSINIRVIVVNQYEQGAYNAYANGRISQKQINWLIATLQSTPANYGVLLSYHANFTDVNKSADYSSFFEDMYDNAPRESSLAGITTQPITRIIDAFIAGSSASFTYTNLLIGSTIETVSVNADFSSLNSGIEFIAHLFGHTHQDTIGYYAGTTEKQLALGVNASAALFETTNNTDLANTQDMARDGKGINQDCFNVYCIDRRNHLVRVAKVGCNMTIELNKRDYMSIPYAD